MILNLLILQVIALLGGFTVTILSFILPSYLHLQIVGYQKIHGTPTNTPGGAFESTKSVETTDSTEAQRRSVIHYDLALTFGGAVLCVVATVVTTIGFMSRVNGEGGSCS